MLSQGSVTVTVVVPEVRTNVVVPEEVTVRVEHAWQFSVVVVVLSLKTGVEMTAELLGAVVTPLVRVADDVEATGVLVEETVDVETTVEDPEVLVDSITV